MTLCFVDDMVQSPSDCLTANFPQNDFSRFFVEKSGCSWGMLSPSPLGFIAFAPIRQSL